jgi:hypothetical protein
MKNQYNYRSLQYTLGAHCERSLSVLDDLGKIVREGCPEDMSRHSDRLECVWKHVGIQKGGYKLAEQKSTTSALYEEMRVFKPSKELRHG